MTLNMSDATKLLKKIVSKDNHWKVELLHGWQQIQLLQNYKVTIEFILDKTLVLGVLHPTIAQQLTMHITQILQQLKQICPQHKIEKLAFRTIDAKKNHNQKKNPNDKTKYIKELQLSLCSTSQYSWQGIILNQKELKSLDSVCCQRLKKLLQKFYAKCKHKEWLHAHANRKEHGFNLAVTQPGNCPKILNAH